jgi:hypothetical protein
MRLVKSYLPAVVFFLAILVPGVSCLYSPALKPYLLTRIKGGDASALEEEVRRTNPVWRESLRLYSTTLYRLGISSNPNAARVGVDGWVFLGNQHNDNFDQAIRKLVVSDADASAWGEILDDQRAWLKSKGIPIIFVFAPMKANIYPEKLPKWARAVREGKESSLDVFKRHTGDELLDLRPALSREKSTGLTYSMLNSHWSSYGAYVAWQDVARRLQQDLPGFRAFGTSPVSKIYQTTYGNEFDAMVNIHVDNVWDVPALTEAQPDIEVMQSDGTWAKRQGDPETDVLDLPRHTRNPAAQNNLKALVLRDSMGNSLSPYIQASFKETFQEHHHFFPGHTLNLPALVEAKKPDVVMYIMTERFSPQPLGNLFYWRSEKAYREARAAPIPMNVSAKASQGGGKYALGEIEAEVPGVVRLQLLASGDTSLRLSYSDKSGRHDAYESVTRGYNELYFALPARAGNPSIEVATVADAVTLDMQRAEIKPAR